MLISKTVRGSSCRCISVRALSTIQQRPTTNIPHQFFSRQDVHRPHKFDTDPADIGRTIRVLTRHLPFLLKDGCLPNDILSDTISLELLPTTLGLPEIKSKTAYVALSRLATWSVNTIVPDAEIMVDSQKLIGSARRCERMVARFRLVDRDGQTVYTGLFHFYFAGDGKINKHVFEIIDNRWSPSHVLSWLVGRKQLVPTPVSQSVSWRMMERKR